MPLQRRLPKSGFTSLRAREEVEVRLHELARVEGEVADLAALKAARVVPGWAKRARVIRSGSLGRAVVVRGVGVTKGARAAIEAAGGRVED
jgi:large subunit ribosomal protein L15